MDQLKQLLARLSLRQRITIGIAVLAVVGGLAALSRWNKERDFRPLFTHVPADDAGQVLTRLRESGVEYRLADNGGSILVPSGKVAELRLQLAAAGLPKSGRIGYELFDKTNFGATDFAEQVNYHRAIEGELERSVLSLSEVEQSRVHITFPKDSIYTEARQPAKASVMVKLKPGAKLSPQNVVAISHLTASAVEGLQPDAVAVLDMNGNLLSRPPRPGAEVADLNDATLEYRQKIERSMLAKVNATLDPVLGAEHYRATVSVDSDINSGEQSEEVFDPTKSVMVASQRSEDSSTGSGTAGLPGTASNLPRPSSRPSTSSTGLNRRTESINFQTSRMVRHTKLPQGGLKRLSASVVLDYDIRVDKGKKVLVAPTTEKMKVVRDLVAGAIGSITDRDQIIVESSPFEATLRWEPPQPPAPPATGGPAGKPAPVGVPAWLQQLMKQKNFPIIAGAAGGVLLLLLAGGVFWFLRRRKKTRAARAAVLEGPKAVDGGATRVAGQVPGHVAAPGEAGAAVNVEQEIEAQIASQAAQRESQIEDIMASLRLPSINTKKTEVLVKHIVGETRKDPAAIAQVMRSWLNPEG